jgi:nucleolar protein 15
MPEAKIRSKAALPKRKTNRKRVAADADAHSLDKTATSKPAKRLRKDDSPSVTRSNTTGRQRSEPDEVKRVEMEEMVTSEKVMESQGKRRQNYKIGTKQKSAQVNGQEAQNVVGKQHQMSQADADAGPPDEEEESENDVFSSKEAEEEEIHLQGFSSESDSSDEELDDMDAPALDISKLPSFSNDDAAVQRKLEKAKKNPVS